jgi:hypothetical protein
MMTLKDKEAINGILNKRRAQRNQEINSMEESFTKQISELKALLISK